MILFCLFYSYLVAMSNSSYSVLYLCIDGVHPSWQLRRLLHLLCQTWDIGLNIENRNLLAFNNC